MSKVNVCGHLIEVADPPKDTALEVRGKIQVVNGTLKDAGLIIHRDGNRLLVDEIR